ncbi:MAG: adenylosuccinate lyase, partial [Candidatus Saccharimonadales bacterium]
NEEAMNADLDEAWPVLTEALQTVMRRYNIDGAYDIIKQASRGKEFNESTYLDLVDELEIPIEAKTRLRNLRPATYIGRAAEIARREI